METKTEEKKPDQTPEKKDAVANVQPTQSERFTAMVMREFGSNAGGNLQLTNFQRKLCQNYFIKIDQVLKTAEQKRLAKDEKYRDALALDWKNVNMQKLALDVVAFSSIGLDPAQPNHINIIPYKNNASNKYDIGFIIGYRGLELKTRKYGLDVPDTVIVELVYATDKFKQIKKDQGNRIESYVFEVTNEFNRGDLVGGFYYLIFNDNPEKNKLRVFNKAQIEKRKPATASVEFWGGEKDKWEYDPNQKKRVKNGTEKVEGWYDEMAYKTISRAAWNAITIDSQKIDDQLNAIMETERQAIDSKVAEEIREHANKGDAIGFEEETTVDAVVVEDHHDNGAAEHEQENQQPAQTKGPGF